MTEKELAEVRRTMAEICGDGGCLFLDGSYPCPEGEDINGSNMCDYCKADYILNHIFTVEGGRCPYCEGTGLIGGAAINDRCSDCNGTGKLPDKTFTLAELVKEKMR